MPMACCVMVSKNVKLPLALIALDEAQLCPLVALSVESLRHIFAVRPSRPSCAFLFRALLFTFDLSESDKPSSSNTSSLNSKCSASKCSPVLDSFHVAFDDAAEVGVRRYVDAGLNVDHDVVRFRDWTAGGTVGRTEQDDIADLTCSTR